MNIIELQTKRANKNNFPNSLDSEFFPSKLYSYGKSNNKGKLGYWKMGWKITRPNSPLAQVASCTRPDEANRKGKIKT